MANMLSLLSGALRNGQKPTGADDAKLKSAHDAALDHYGNVLRSTNDKGQIELAHKALLDATAAMAGK